jgi:hypothetical protein
LAAEDTRMKAGLKTAEDELNLIKNQVQQTLLDIREHILDATNPFSAIDDALTDEDEIEFGDDLMGGAAGVAGAAGAEGEGGGGEGSDGAGDSEGSDDVDDLLDEDADGSDDELLDDEFDDPGEEIVEEYPDDGYMGDEIIDDGMGGGGSSGMGDQEEVFEEEEIVPDEDEGFELDEESSAGDLDLEDVLGEAEPSTDGSARNADGLPVSAAVADFDVLTMAGLVRWVAVTTERLGPNRTEILLDAFEAAGRIATSTRAVLHHLMALSEEDPSENVPVREIVSAMVRMEGVLDSSKNTNSSRLLSMLMDVDDDPMDRLLA